MGSNNGLRTLTQVQIMGEGQFYTRTRVKKCKPFRFFLIIFLQRGQSRPYLNLWSWYQKTVRKDSPLTFLGNFFIGGFTWSAPEMAIINNFRGLFRPYLIYMTCFSWSMVIIISVILVMAINYRKKFELRVEKKRNYLK